MKLIVYGTRNCQDTVEALETFARNGIDVDFRDIDKDTKTMKEFLALRDTKEIFAPVRECHKIGVPCVIKENGTMTLDWEEIVR